MPSILGIVVTIVSGDAFCRGGDCGRGNTLNTPGLVSGAATRAALFFENSKCEGTVRERPVAAEIRPYFYGLKCLGENRVAAPRLGRISCVGQDSATLRPGLRYGRACGARLLRCLFPCRKRR
jgi:hypothetical protein